MISPRTPKVLQHVLKRDSALVLICSSLSFDSGLLHHREQIERGKDMKPR